MAKAPSSATAIIGRQYCAPNNIDLVITKERTLADTFTVTDVNGNVVFRVKSDLITFLTPRNHRYLLDANGNPILHLRRALFAANDSWKAYKGDSSTEPNDLIFTRKRSSLMQLRTKLDVSLANNATQVCDYKIKENLSGRSCVVYKGESDTIVAQMNKKFIINTALSREKFMVTVSPNVDYAFIVALMVTLNALK